eukprot:scaffold175_cov414-Prasinococcus_capsulatus_cf.AAC.43
MDRTYTIAQAPIADEICLRSTRKWSKLSTITLEGVPFWHRNTGIGRLNTGAQGSLAALGLRLCPNPERPRELRAGRKPRKAACTESARPLAQAVGSPC